MIVQQLKSLLWNILYGSYLLKQARASDIIISASNVKHVILQPMSSSLKLVTINVRVVETSTGTIIYDCEELRKAVTRKKLEAT